MQTHIRVSKETNKALKIISAHLGFSMVELADKLLTRELKKMFKRMGINYPVENDK